MKGDSCIVFENFTASIVDLMVYFSRCQFHSWYSM